MSDHAFDLESLTKKMTDKERLTFNKLREIGAIQVCDETGHFKSEKFERHGPVRVNHDLIYVHSETMESLSGAIANHFQGGNVEVVIGSEHGGRHLAAVVSAAMRRQLTKPQRPFYSLWAERRSDGFRIPEELKRFVYGKRVMVVEDVVMTGDSLKFVVDEVRRCGGEPFAAAAIWNRGGCRAKDFGVGTYFSLIDIQLPDWPAHECPLCKVGNPLNPFIGYASENVFVPGHCGTGGRQAIGEALGAVVDESFKPFTAEELKKDVQREPGEDPPHSSPPDDPDFKNRSFD